jgi:predicted HTH transcriptional regulator
LQNIISSPFKDSDLSEFMVKKLTDEIFARVDTEIKKDVRHMGNMNNLWKQAAAQGFTSEGKDRITNAYLSRAKLLIAKYRQQVLSEAKVSAKIRPGNVQKRQATRITPSSTSVSRIPGKIDGKKVNWDKTSERDMLDGKVSLK